MATRRTGKAGWRKGVGLIAIGLPILATGCANREPSPAVAAQPPAPTVAPQAPKVPESGFTPGKTTTVATKYQDKEYHYNCFVPKSLKKDRPVVIVINTSPEGDAAPLSKASAEKLGWVMVGLVEARNGPGQPIYENFVSTVQDLAGRFNIHPRGLVFSGFSGGSRSSFFFAKRFGDMCSGIIAIGAGSYGTPGELAPDIPVFFITGESDFNREEVEGEAAREKKAGRVCTIEVHSGGHGWGPEALHEKALSWIASKMPPS